MKQYKGYLFDIDVLIIALDIELDLKKLEIACKLLKKY